MIIFKVISLIDLLAAPHLLLLLLICAPQIKLIIQHFLLLGRRGTRKHRLFLRDSFFFVADLIHLRHRRIPLILALPCLHSLVVRPSYLGGQPVVWVGHLPDMRHRIEVLHPFLIVVKVGIYRQEWRLLDIGLGHRLVHRVRLEPRYRCLCRRRTLPRPLNAPRRHTARRCRRLVIHHPVDNWPRRLAVRHTVNHLLGIDLWFGAPKINMIRITIIAAIVINHPPLLHVVLDYQGGLHGVLPEHSTAKSAGAAVLMELIALVVVLGAEDVSQILSQLLPAPKKKRGAARGLRVLPMPLIIESSAICCLLLLIVVCFSFGYRTQGSIVRQKAP